MLELVAFYWPHATTIVVVVVSVFLAGTVILYKRNEGAAIAWVGLILLSPVMGSIAYLLFGVNRIRRRAVRTRPASATLARAGGLAGQGIPPGRQSQSALDRLIDQLSSNPCVVGNTVGLLRNGDEAYPEMISAVDGAQRSVALSAYIFKSDTAGLAFAEALQRARSRGVEVRVLVDGVGRMYSLPTIVSVLRKGEIPVARYLHSVWPWQMPYLNLRNHRKIMVVDGTVAFTGGINISDNNRLQADPRRPVRDLHFRIEGRVVTQLADAFADDWEFTTRETLTGDAWFPRLDGRGDVDARAILAGPHEPIDRTRWVLQAAILEAREHIRILTPYFLPDDILVSALRLAAIKGVEIDIVIPARSNLFFVDWAVRARLDELLDDGCRIWLGPVPFNHAKLTLVDGDWALIGSSNWDPRSLRLNFELNVECRSEALVDGLSAVFDAERDASHRLTMDEIRSRPILVRLRDGIARLFAPYL